MPEEPAPVLPASFPVRPACAREVIVGSGDLQCADIAALAAMQASARVSDEGRERARRSYRHARQASAQRDVYGRTTGVGANRNVTIANPDAHAIGLLRSHATAAGPFRSAERVRAMLTVRLNQLAAGGSGVTPAALEGLAWMLADNALPPVREHGSVGTGDVPALAVTALAMIGEVETSPPMSSVVKCSPLDVISIMNSNAATIGDAALACTGLASLSRAALSVSAFTFAAVDGNSEAFSEIVERVTPFAGARTVCSWMRGHTAATLPARIQDPFGLRALPQVHGAFLDQLTRLDEVIVRYANAPSENPAFLPGHDIAHHAGFYAAYLAQALDATVSAAAQSAHLSLARLAMLVEPEFTGLTAFLGHSPGASGVMACEYVAASALGSLRALAAPASLQTVTLSRGVEEDASFASQAAWQALQAIPSYRTVLACELVAAIRALRLRGAEPGGPASQLSADLDDRSLSADIAAAEGLIPALATVN
jgi:histidine ammonia-lyase